MLKVFIQNIDVYILIPQYIHLSHILQKINLIKSSLKEIDKLTNAMPHVSY